MGFIQLLLNAISPQLRELIVDFILKFSSAAEKTDNPLDDIVAGLLITVFAIKNKKELSK